MPKTLTLASTMMGTMRAIQVSDADKMSDHSLLYDLRHVLRDGFTLLDPGVYPAPFNWAKTFFCDRFELMLTCSALTYGPEYRFKYPCKNPDNPCRHKEGGDRPHPIPWKLSLNDLKRKPLPESTLERLRSGENRFETMAVLGEDWEEAPKKVAFRLLDEEAEVATANRLEHGWGRKKKATIQARAQVLQVGDISDPKKLDDLFSTLNKGMVELLRLKMEEADGGVQTKVAVVCDRCGWEESIQLPLGGLFSTRHAPWEWEKNFDSSDAVLNSSSPST
jgi:hypothetical protein